MISPCFVLPNGGREYFRCIVNFKVFQAAQFGGFVINSAGERVVIGVASRTAYEDQHR